jgi:hypothetical protein
MTEPRIAGSAGSPCSIVVRSVTCSLVAIPKAVEIFSPVLPRI